MLIELIIVVLLIVFVTANWKMLFYRYTLPPGPFPWPLIGNLFQLDAIKPHVTCLEWSKIYGPVFTMWIGMEPAIIITDYEIMKEALTKHGDQLSSRPNVYALKLFTKGNFGLVMSNGELWKEQRRFSLQTLRSFGLGRNLMEEKILFEAKRLVASVREDMGSGKEIVMDLTMPIHLCIGSIISSILFGHTFEKGDDRYKILKDTVNENFRTLGSLTVLLLNSCPWLRYLPLLGHFGMDELQKQDHTYRTFLTAELENHKLELLENENDDDEPKDFSAAYLKEMKRRQRVGEDISYFSEWQLLVIAEDLWIAGMETTVTTLRWAFLAMIKYPHAQQKARQEIDAVLGRERLPSMSDRQSMPYVVATINEVQRWGNITPFNLYRTNDTDFRLGDFTIPKNVQVIPQIGCLAIDEKMFPSPDRFMPERFLENDGKTLKNMDRIAPFSMGKRQCTGESLARAELFLIFVYVLQNFRFSVAPGQEEPTAEPTTGMALCPRDYECLVTLREA